MVEAVNFIYESLARSCNAELIFEDESGVTRNQSIKELIKDTYKIKRVTYKQVERFFKDAIDKKIILGFDDCSGLYVESND